MSQITLLEARSLLECPDAGPHDDISALIKEGLRVDQRISRLQTGPLLSSPSRSETGTHAVASASKKDGLACCPFAV